MKYLDCNESSWQADLVVHGERVRCSYRVASDLLRNELTAKSDRLEEGFRRLRQEKPK